MKNLIEVRLLPARNGGIMAKIDGKVAFPDRRHPCPYKPGDIVYIQLTGENPKGTVYFFQTIESLKERRRREQAEAEAEARKYAEEECLPALLKAIKKYPHWKPLQNLLKWYNEKGPIWFATRCGLGQIEFQIKQAEKNLHLKEAVEDILKTVHSIDWKALKKIASLYDEAKLESLMKQEKSLSEKIDSLGREIERLDNEYFRNTHAWSKNVWTHVDESEDGYRPACTFRGGWKAIPEKEKEFKPLKEKIDSLKKERLELHEKYIKTRDFLLNLEKEILEQQNTLLSKIGLPALSQPKGKELIDYYIVFVQNIRLIDGTVVIPIIDPYGEGEVFLHELDPKKIFELPGPIILWNDYEAFQQETEQTNEVQGVSLMPEI